MDKRKLIRDMETRMKLNDLLVNIRRLTGFTVEEMQSESRLRELVYTRTAFCAIAKETIKATHWQIGAMICKDHSTVTFMIQQSRDVKEKRELCQEMSERLKKHYQEYADYSI